MVEKFDSATISAGAILMEYPKLSIEQIVQMLASGVPPSVVRPPIAQKHLRLTSMRGRRSMPQHSITERSMG
jgi:hypothetical protein